MEKLYTYAVARVKSRETSLLSASDIEQLISADSVEACMSILADKGLDGNGTTQSYEELLAEERRKLWDFVFDLAGDLSVFDILRMESDFHNLKASVKASYTGILPERIFQDGGTVDAQIIYKSVKDREFSDLPDFLKVVAGQAVSVINKTGDGQLSDCLIDKAYVTAILNKAEKSGDGFLLKLSKLFGDIAAVKVAVRCSVLGKDAEFTNLALPECSLFNKDSLITSSISGIDSLKGYVRLTSFSGCADIIDNAPLFERWCDNRIMDFAKEQKADYFTIAPIAAYILARINELKVIRIVMSSKKNGFSEEIVRERLRDMYV